MAKTRRAGFDRAAPGSLRIVAGKWRRRLLPVAAVDGLRPTSERVRETLFNWLAPHLDGARCLDLCAGSGALGFEALSRGAAAVTLIEKSRTAVSALHKSAELLGADDAAIVCRDSRDWLQSETATAFDIVFIDPPYAAGLVADLCRLLELHGWLAADALIYLEHERRAEPPALPDHWRVLKDKTAGNVRYLLLTRQPKA